MLSIPSSFLPEDRFPEASLPFSEKLPTRISFFLYGPLPGFTSDLHNHRDDLNERRPILSYPPVYPGCFCSQATA